MKEVTYSAKNARRIELVLGETLSAEGGENTEPEAVNLTRAVYGRRIFHVEKPFLRVTQSYISR
jgi:hypothetical protein